ncbi:MAG: hypothetical protein NTW74_01190 [Acidobacteria bacterium]|nr:hypothetical protein [Acidobacteriota bacterium]
MTSTALLSPTSGELLAAEIRVSPRHLEDILEALASATFPINPELDHTAPALTRVRFPIYDSQLASLREILATAGFTQSQLEVHSLATELNY